MKESTYRFNYISRCEMCGEDSHSHKILGQRLSHSQGFNPRRKKGITTTIVRCRTCGLIYPNPQPIPLSLQDHYDVPAEDYWKPEYFKFDPQYFSHQIARIRELGPFAKGMKALDIGAGLGKCMISLAGAGFDVYGVEASNSFYSKAIQVMKIDPGKLKLGMIEDVEYEADFFDFITFGAVLEHLYRPSLAIERAMRWLKPGGLMHVEVPSSDYLISKLINFYYTLIATPYVTNTSPMHEPYHLYEFTYGSFDKLAARTGSFDIAFHEYFVCSASPFPSFARPILTRIMDASKTGMQLSVWLRKV